ncbi:uncharacterized protein TrAtP1_010268 [Trichoderma atroviride]|uniref:uncharacterized protein n=1 Tax=Hypocrea atroviridis TaxID=63577 RepID=UPI003332FDD5|nr:hypothetical protein TrAtP1_010268 [Trichoderma atroviride]
MQSADEKTSKSRQEEMVPRSESKRQSLNSHKLWSIPLILPPIHQQLQPEISLPLSSSPSTSTVPSPNLSISPSNSTKMRFPAAQMLAEAEALHSPPSYGGVGHLYWFEVFLLRSRGFGAMASAPSA